MSSTAKLTAEQIENLAKEIREFLLEHGLWQDVDIYFNGKRFTQHDPVTGKYYYNDREHLIEVADQPERHFEYVNPEHILSMSFEGPVCEMLYYGILPSVRREFDKIDHELHIDCGMVDAEVADAIIQYALFGEIIYG